MRRILFVLMSTLAVVVLLFGYRTSTPSPAVPGTSAVAAAGSGTDSSTGSSTGSAATTVPAAPSSSGSGSSSGASGTETVTGRTVQTRWGPVQVRVTVTGGQLTVVDALQVPSGNSKDVRINRAAVPVLEREALQAQSADIDAVSGATYTSEGYITSLQSALDQAGL